MPITLLLDLDDTLLNSNMDAFIPAYFQALSKAMADLVAPEVMLPALMGGTKAMIENMDPGLTLKQVFDAHFYPALKIEPGLLKDRIDRFYDEEFPKLGVLTSPIPEAVQLVERAFEEGMRVVIATNPVFPQKAVQHRLRWAGLAPEKYPFALITSYEKFHFTKEAVAYYPEVMAQLGWPDDPVVMVGDDEFREVKPTQAAGMSMFWVRKDGDVTKEAQDIPHGKLGDFQGWLEKSDPEQLKMKFETAESVLANLRSTPAALATMTEGFSTNDWKHTAVEGEWSPTEITCHIRDVDREVNLPRIRKVIEGGNPFLPGEITDVWVKERNCAEQDGRQALVDFIKARKEMIEVLESLNMDWSQPARHAIFGPTTLQELVGFMAGHDRVHVNQLWKSR